MPHLFLSMWSFAETFSALIFFNFVFAEMNFRDVKISVYGILICFISL